MQGLTCRAIAGLSRIDPSNFPSHRHERVRCGGLPRRALACRSNRSDAIILVASLARMLAKDPASVAQLDRAGGFYPPGCAFESCRGLEKNIGLVTSPSVVMHDASRPLANLRATRCSILCDRRRASEWGYLAQACIALAPPTGSTQVILRQCGRRDHLGGYFCAGFRSVVLELQGEGRGLQMFRLDLDYAGDLPLVVRMNSVRPVEVE